MEAKLEINIHEYPSITVGDRVEYHNNPDKRGTVKFMCSPTCVVVVWDNQSLNNKERSDDFYFETDSDGFVSGDHVFIERLSLIEDREKDEEL